MLGESGRPTAFYFDYLLVPTLYAFVALGLKWIAWQNTVSDIRYAAAQGEIEGELVTSAR